MDLWASSEGGAGLGGREYVVSGLADTLPFGVLFLSLCSFPHGLVLNWRRPHLERPHTPCQRALLWYCRGRA